MKIRRENHTTYTNVPAPFLDKLKPIFDAQGFEYTVYNTYDDEVPDDIGGCFEFEGHLCWRGVVTLKSNMNSDDVRELVRKAWNPFKYGELPNVNANEV